MSGQRGGESRVGCRLRRLPTLARHEPVDVRQVDSEPLDTSHVDGPIVDTSRVNASQIDVSHIDSELVDASQIDGEIVDASRIVGKLVDNLTHREESSHIVGPFTSSHPRLVQAGKYCKFFSICAFTFSFVVFQLPIPSGSTAKGSGRPSIPTPFAHTPSPSCAKVSRRWILFGFDAIHMASTSLPFLRHLCTLHLPRMQKRAGGGFYSGFDTIRVASTSVGCKSECPHPRRRRGPCQLPTLTNSRQPHPSLVDDNNLDCELPPTTTNEA